jgi:hypothetical protein
MTKLWAVETLTIAAAGAVDAKGVCNNGLEEPQHRALQTLNNYRISPSDRLVRAVGHGSLVAPVEIQERKQGVTTA